MLDFVQLWWWLILLCVTLGPIAVIAAKPFAKTLSNHARAFGKDLDALDAVSDCESLLHELRGLPLYDGLPQDMQNRTQDLITRLDDSRSSQSSHWKGVTR